MMVVLVGAAELPVLIQVAIGAATIGGAFAGVKMGLNGTVKRVEGIEKRSERIESKVDRLGEGHAKIREDVANLKGKLGAA